MKNLLLLIAVAGFSLFMTSCNKTIPADLSSVAFIPHPVKVQASGVSFQLERNNVIEISDADKLKPLAEFLKSKLNSFTGLEYEIKVVTMASGKNIYLGLDSNTLNNDGYQLEITKVGVTMIAKEEQGIFYGIQTLLQSITFNDEYLEWIIPGGTILDYSKYAYRGVMLDVARHFFSVDDVKQLIDLMAAYKLNNLHLHLSDDQGWRIEIKSWPKLTEIGSTTAVNGDKGGYYTQEQYKEIVRYAKEHFITIIPEIDMPGHTNAALASYAELNCDNKARDLYTGIEVGFSTLCTNKEVTYQFVEDVIRELAEITEGPYIHIGGDESLVTEKDDYIYFMNRVREITKKYDKKVMGWDEIAHADIDKNDVVQYWSVDENATLAVSKGAKVLMSPSKKAYLDMQYDSTTHLGLHWAAYIELDSAYMWKPEEMIEGVGKDQILGVESPLWTETITNLSEMQYMMFPRLVGHAEIGWSPNEHLNWEEYKMRLAKHSAYLEKLNINYYKSPQIDWPIE
ncbi:family 20 glycosylhydrolase [Carboxylicivirga linearis]|uniref:beta-N-acetylhexosaminidase n=1 Tax=Carboxylicivirga linearis TaxID=1628157 RepID=A0ABS5JUU9_9BACT|nr:family 20 glycosylhydrolase [Carboxylicivirga linearis]MBS2098570.1 beta-N-acetylhexosaminidase [Carboxylicivirga linearis]